MDFLECLVYDRPPLVLGMGSRGAGKTYLSGFATHCDSMSWDGHDTMILGGSEAQSGQMYQALREFEHSDIGLNPIVSFNRERATYENGSTVAYIPASQKSVRGPHVPTLRLDEVDEIDSDIRESSLGMCMDMGGRPASVSMTSTWHRVGGPMADLLERGDAGDFPVFRFCAFEVLERCPEERSGPNLENCPACPLKKWCWSDKDGHGAGIPKAKRSAGHYTIDSLIQKVRGVSARVFESDYLCLGPKADGVWFTQFDEPAHVAASAEFDPALPVYLSIDSGVWTGAVLLQFRPGRDNPRVNVFGEYLAENPGAEHAARAIMTLADSLCGTAERHVSTDSSGGSRNPVGPSVLAEYERAGLRGKGGVVQWPKYPGCVASGLATIEALLQSADGAVSLTIHPRCTNLIAAFRAYRRAKRAGQWMDYPDDPQHPHEDLIDAVRGQLAILMPEGRKPELRMRRISPSRVF